MNPYAEREQGRAGSTAQTRIRRCVSVALLLGVASFVIGALLVALDSPESCRGWPHCSNSASADNDMLLHLAHRLSGVVLIVTIGIATAYAYATTSTTGWLTKILTVTFAFGLVHAVLGGVGTTIRFPDGFSAVHLTLALVLSALLLAIFVWLTPSLQAASPVPVGDATLHAGASVALTSILVVASATTIDLGDAPAFGTPGGALVAIATLAIVATLALVWLAATSGGASRLVALVDLAILAVAGLATVLWDVTGQVEMLQALPPVLLFGASLASGAVALDRTRSTLIPAIEGSRPSLDARVLKAIGRDFARVTKPGIMLLLLTTTFTSMLVAAQGWPGLELVLWTLLGGALASGGASSMNCYLDRDIDRVMARTRKRPIPTGTLSGEQVRGFALLLSFGAVLVLATFVNPLAAGLALAGNLFYVGVYTLWLKRSTPQNIVIGGAAGSFPPLVGWAAVTGSLGIVPLLLAAIVFYWTPPHFWSLALLKANDYRRAGIPMLPVSHGDAYTRRAILLYTFLLVAVTLLVVPAGGAGPLYLLAATGLGAIFLGYAWRMFRENSSRLAWPLFKHSNYYLALLLVVLVIDRALA